MIWWITGTKAVQLIYKLPIQSSDDVIQQYKDILDGNPNIKVAVIGMNDILKPHTKANEKNGYLG